jgi:hypothetical protein
MTDRAQFEAMLEALINEDQDAAKEIFHNIVVGKSREIYEELLAEDFSPEEANRAAGGHTQSESMEEEGAEEDVEEDMEEEGADEEGDDDSEDNPFGGEDDGEEEPEDDGEDDEFGGEDDAEGGDMEDRVMDLEDALEDLKAEFEQLLSQEGEEGGHDMDAIHDAGMGGDDDMEMGMDDEGSHMPVMEYYKKVSVSHGDNGQNTKSTIDNMKNDMGGSAKNIAQSFSTEKGGTQGGLAAPTTKPLIGDVQNSVKANAGKTSFKKQEPGHGAEKKGKGESNVDKKSLIGGKIR